MAIAAIAAIAGAAIAGAVEAVPRPHDAAAVETLAAAAVGEVAITLHPATGTVRFARVVGDGGFAVTGTTADTPAADPAARALAFLRRHAAAFGLADPDAELTLAGIERDADGAAHLAFRQHAGPYEVVGGLVRVHFDGDGALRAVNGVAIPRASLPDLKAGSTLDATAARRAARVEVAHAAGVPARRLRTGDPALVVFHDGLLRGVPGTVHLAWRVAVDGAAESVGRAETAYVDATSGRLVARMPRRLGALRREVYDGGVSAARRVWREGNPLPYAGSGNVDDDRAINTIIEATGATHALFERLAGRTSWDGANAIYRALYRNPAVQCPNAVWGDGWASFCPGTAAVDVVAHEWTHAVTETTHGLFFQWQPGALNEATSDIFGEAVDLLDDPPGSRSDATCSELGRNPLPAVAVETPADIAGVRSAGGALFGSSLEPPTRGTLVAVEDAADEAGPSPTDGCSTPANAAALAGAIAFVDRGVCTFVQKARLAQAAGAIGLIVVNLADAGIVGMAGDAPDVHIPVVSLGRDDGAAIRARLGEGVIASITTHRPGESTLRWLVGEDAEAFGGAFRDLWNPGCFADPGHVGDSWYVCGPGEEGNDWGGIHSNSTVPAHAFALLVDGGTWRGVTVPAIGLVKALHVEWRAMSRYQTPVSDFADHADALAIACDDLVRSATDLPSPSTGRPSGEVMTAADCAAVDAAALAVALRQPPVRCDFTPLLQPVEPPACGQGTTVEVFRDGLEGGTAGWQFRDRGVYRDWTPRSWELAGDLPDGRPGTAFFAPAPAHLGDCRPGSDDQSGVLTLDSPTLTLPPGAVGGHVDFRQWVATEPDHDGGVLRLQVGPPGGPWRLVDRGFLVNGYTGTLDPGSANPLAGLRAWTGTDDGALDGSWGLTRLDLGSWVRPGESFRLRFELGTDGCEGRVGWYLDDLVVARCEPQPAAHCVEDGSTLCLLEDRFRLRVDWENPGTGRSGAGIARPHSDLTGFFAFDDPSNLELVVKTLVLGDAVKLFVGQLTDLPFALTVTDLRTGAARTYRKNGRGGDGICGILDPAAFPKAAAASGSCDPSDGALCLLDGRIRAEVAWRSPYDDSAGDGVGTRLTDLSGLFAFGDPRNVEVVVKALDFGDRILVLWGSLSDFEYTLRLTDTASGEVREYRNPPGTFCGGIDPDAF